MIAERDLGDVKRHARDVAPYRPRINPPGRSPRPGRERRKTPSNRSSSSRKSTRPPRDRRGDVRVRSEEHTSELQSLMRISYAVFCLKKKIKHRTTQCNKEYIKRIIKNKQKIEARK